LAGLAETKELKHMAVYFKPVLLRQALLQFTKVMPGEIDNFAAVRANQMVVVLWGANCVAAVDASGVQLADEL